MRVIAATHRDLPDMVERGAFRADLFYRLNTLILRIPPLRERRDEIQPLAMRFLERANRDNRRQVQAISSEALDALRAHDWPGNVRELYNAIERAVVVCHGDRIERRDLPESVRAAPEPHAQPDAGEGDDQGRGLAALEPASPSPEQATDLRTLMQEHETRLITEALDACAWNRTQAARRLAMSLRTLRHKIKTLGIVKPKA